MIGSSKKTVGSPTPSATPEPASSPTPSSSTSDQKFNALLGKGSEFEGKLSFEGTVRVDGIMKGEIHSKDKLVIGDGAKINAEISVGSAIISGEIEGNITAKERVELKSPAKLKGNITTPVLVIEEGVMFDGACSMGSRGNAVPSRPSTPATASEPPKDKAE